MKFFFDKDAGDGTGGGGGQAVEKLKVGDKEYSADDVNGLITELGGLKTHAQTISQLDGMAKTFNLDVGEFAQQGLAALRVVNDLISNGVIDETGKIVEKPQDDKGDVKGKGDGGEGGGDDDLDLDDLFKLDKGDGKEGGGKKVSAKLQETMQRLIAPLNETIDTLNKRLEKSEALTTGILEQDFTNKIIAKFPNLAPADVKNVFVSARADRTKTLMDHAEEASRAKVAQVAEIEKSFAERYGLSVEQLNENMLREQETKNGAPPAKEGVKITFRKGVKGGVSPGELAGDYLKHKIG